MALFDNKPRRLLKNIQKLTSDNLIDQAAVKIEQEYPYMIESQDVARELVAFLLDIAYPDLAARISEEIFRKHVDLRGVILRHLDERHVEFPRSYELLRVLWHTKMMNLDFSGCISLLNRVDRIAEAKLFDSLESASKAAERYALDDRILTGEVEKFLSWCLALHRKGRNREALEILAKVAENIGERDNRIPKLIDWIATRRGGRDPEATLFLIKSYIGMGDIKEALADIPVMFDAPVEVVLEAISVLEKDIIPKDLSNKSRVYLARLHAVAGRFDDACGILEHLIEEEQLDTDVERAVEFIEEISENRARPLLVKAKYKKASGEITEAIDSMILALKAEDVKDSPIIEVSREFFDSDIDRDGAIAREYARVMTEHGSPSEAVEALGRIVKDDTEWVIAQLQDLLSRKVQSVEVLTLLAVAMNIQGRGSDAERTFLHLEKRGDKRTFEDMLLVLDRFDNLADSSISLRKIRSSIRWKANHKKDSAEDYIQLFISGIKVQKEILDEIIKENLHHEKAKDLIKSGKEPENSLEAFIMAGAALSEKEMTNVSKWLLKATEESDLLERIAGEILNIDADLLDNIDLSTILPELSKSNCTREISRILLKTSGRDEWRINLINTLVWGNPVEEAEFRLSTLISEGLLSIAGSSIENLDLDDEVLKAAGKGASLFGRGEIQQALEAIQPAVDNARLSSLLRTMMISALENAGSLKSNLILSIAKTCRVESMVKEAVKWIEKVELRTPGAIELLEEIIFEDSPDKDALILLAKSMYRSGDLEKFRKYSGMLLDLSPDYADELLEMALKLGDVHHLAEAYIYAAEISRQFDIDESREDLLIKALQTDRSVAKRLSEMKGTLGFKALCYLVAGDGDKFSGILSRHEGIEVPIDPGIISEARDRFKAGSSDQTLWNLVKVTELSGFRDQKIEILVDLAQNGEGTWSIDAAKELLREAENSPETRLLFWKAIHHKEVIEEALAVLMPGDVDACSSDELAAIGVAAIRSDLSGSQVDAIVRLLMEREDHVLDDIRKKLAMFCFKSWENDNTSLDSMELVRILLVSSLTGEATEVGLASGENRILFILREGLEKIRQEKTDPEDATNYIIAQRLLDINDIDCCIKTLSGVNSNADEKNLLSVALWEKGFRIKAIEGWLTCYRLSGEGRFLQKAHWASGKAGFVREQAAIRRIIALKYPDLLIGLGTEKHTPKHLRTIS